MNLTELINSITTFIDNKDYYNAEIAIDKVIQQYPDEAVGYYLKGKLLQELNNIEAAINFFEKADQIKSSEDIKIALCLAYLENLETDKASQLLTKLSPDNYPEYYFAKAALHLRNMEEDLALKALDELINLLPDHNAALELRATLNKNLQNEEEAIEDLTKLLELNPKNEQVRFLRIDINKALNNKKEIEEDYAFLIQNAPNSPDFRLKLGEYYDEIGEWSDAIYTFSDAVEILARSTRGRTIPLRKRANCYLKLGSYKESIEDYKILLNDKNPPATDYLGIAEAYEALNKIESAVFYLNLGIDLVDKDRWKLLEKLGQFYLRDMKFEEAEHVFRKMTFEEQGKAEGFYQLGLLYLKQGDVESAYDVLKESEAHFHEKAQDLIIEFCQEFLAQDKLAEEMDRISDYKDFITENSKSILINNISGKYWQLDLKNTFGNNESLKNLEGEWKDKVAFAFENLFFVMTAFGWTIFKVNQQETRAIYKILEEGRDELIIESWPFGMSFAKDMNIKMINNQLVIYKFGVEKTLFDLYFNLISIENLKSEEKQYIEHLIKSPSMSFMLGK